MKIIRALICSLSLLLSACGGPSYISYTALQRNYALLNEKSAEYQEYAQNFSLIAFFNEHLIQTAVVYAIGVGGDPEVPKEHKDAIIEAARKSAYARYLLNKSAVALDEGSLDDAKVYLELAKSAVEEGVKILQKARDFLDKYWAKKKHETQQMF